MTAHPMCLLTAAGTRWPCISSRQRSTRASTHRLRPITPRVTRARRRRARKICARSRRGTTPPTAERSHDDDDDDEDDDDDDDDVKSRRDGMSAQRRERVASFHVRDGRLRDGRCCTQAWAAHPNVQMIRNQSCGEVGSHITHMPRWREKTAPRSPRSQPRSRSRACLRQSSHGCSGRYCSW